MSWEAVTWATRQRMKSSHEQLVLLVLANCADPDGVAFARWPGREHWWKYLVDLTRLSKSTLFRDINTLIELGLCSRSMLVMSDGTKRPTIQLDLAARHNYDEIKAQTEERSGHSQPGNEAEHDADDSENVNDDSDFDDENPAAEIHSHTETDEIHSQSRTNPFPVVGMHKDSLLVPKDSPQPPSGGPAHDGLWDQFVKAWGEGIPKFALAQQAWGRLATDKRGKAVASARGYWAWVRSHSEKRKPTPISAQAFLKDDGGFEQWLRYTPSGDTPAAAVGGYALATPEGKAICRLHEIADLAQFLKDVKIRNGSVYFSNPVTKRLLALADAPTDRDAWVVLTHQQAMAWEGLLRESISVATRTRLREGSRAPWPWPPSKDGTVYTTTGPPPDALMTDDDYANI